MGFRGPMRDPDSRRGRIEGRDNPTESIQDRISPPEWLTAKEIEFFVATVDKQIAAGVGIREVDAELYGRYARISLTFRASKDPKKLAPIQRALEQLESQLGIGEKERKRLGVRVPKRETNPMAKLIRMPSAATGTDDV